MAIQLTTNYQLISSFDLTYGAIRLYAKYNSQSRENNQTAYQLKEVYYCNQSGGYVGFYNGVGVVDGSTKDYGSGYTRMYYGETVIQEVSRTINHNTDGSSPIKNVAYSWSASFGGSGSSSVDISFPKIDRYPMITNAPNFNDEENPTIQYSTTMGFSEATVQACISIDGSTPLVAFRDVNVPNGSYTFNLTNAERDALRNATPNSNVLNVTFILRTRANSTNYDSKITKQMRIVNANPTFTYTKEETNLDVIDLYSSASANTIVQNASIVQFTVSPTALKGASISNVSITHDGIDYSTSTSPYQVTIPITTNTFTFNITDSRGNVSTNTITITMIEYQPVNIRAFSFERVNPTSSNIIVNLEADYYQVSFGVDQNQVAISWKLDNGIENIIPSTEYIIDVANKTISIYNYEIANILTYNLQGTFTIRVRDYLSTDTDKQNVTKGIATFEAGEHDFQVNGELFIADISRNNAKEIRDLIYPVGSIYISVNSTNPSTLFGGTWEAFATGKTLVGIDTNDSDFNTVGATGGSKTHTHGSDTTQNGTLSAVIGATSSNPARIGYAASNLLSVSQTTATYSILGSSLEQNASFNHYTEVRGTTASESSLQPYITVYIWKRVS